MIPFLICAKVLLRVCIGLIGAAALYCACFLYEDEEGKLQNRVEQLWVAVNDRKKATGSMAAAFLNNVGSIAKNVLDRMFGQPVVSVQLIGVSTSLSLGSFFLFGILISKSDFLSVNNRGGLFICLLCLFCGFLPSVSPSRWSAVISLTPLLLHSLMIGGNFLQRRNIEGEMGSVFALLLSCLSDIVLIVLTRLTIRWIANESSVLKIALCVLFQLALITVLIVLPYEVLPVWASSTKEGFRHGLLLLIVFNLPTGFVASIFLLLLFVVMAHRIVWPLLDRMIYPAARFEIVRNRKAMVGFGAACFAVISPPFAELLKKVTEMFR